MSASMQGAMAFQKGLGCVHSLSHSLGGANPKLHHGTLNAMFLPAVVKFNAARRVDAARSGAWSGWRRRWAWRASDDSGDAVAEAIRDMNARLGLPSGLAALGVTRAMYERIIDGAMADHCHKTNPRLATPRRLRRDARSVDVALGSGRRLTSRIRPRRAASIERNADRSARRAAQLATAGAGVALVRTPSPSRSLWSPWRP